MINNELGRRLVTLARGAIDSYLNKRKLRIDNPLRKNLSDRLPVYVTLNKNKKLRGSMGFVENFYPLYEGTAKAAINAAFSDPRFPPLEESEFNEIVISVSVFSVPALIEVRNPEDYLKSIVPGRDGIIVVSTFHSGIILPHTAVENNWNSETMLKFGCKKANLHPESWRDFDLCRVYKFKCQEFSETEIILPKVYK